MATDEIIKVVSAILQGVSVVAAATSVILGVKAWRKQLIGKRKFEVAEDAAILFTRVRQSFDYVRSPASYQGEAKKMMVEGEVDYENNKQLEQYYVTLKRLFDVRDDFAKIQTTQILVRLHIGSDAADLFEVLLKVRGEVKVAAEMLIMTKPEAGEIATKENLDLRKKWRQLIWAVPGDDVLAVRLDEAQKKMLELSKPFLKV